MRHTDAAMGGLATLIERFPADAALIQRLARADESFDAICEEYGLAQLSLAGFEARLDAARRPEVAEYRLVIADLENEIARMLRNAS